MNKKQDRNNGPVLIYLKNMCQPVL